MAIRIDTRELREVLKLTPQTQNIMLIGKHGIGKSEIVTHFYKEQGMKVVPFFLGQMSDPGDLIGLMHKDEETGVSVFLPPYWWPVDGQPIVLFLDELNRARPEILQAVQDLALNRTLAGKHLPDGSILISAVNEGDEYQLTELDPALVSRFNLYEFAPSVEDWLLWANANDVDKRVIDFLQQNPHHLDGEEVGADEAAAAAGLVKTQDRRAWVKVSDFLKPLNDVNELHIKIIAGMVGIQPAIALQQSLAAKAIVTVEQIMLNFSRHRKKLADMPLPDLILLNEQIALWINTEKYKEDDIDKVLTSYLKYLKELQKLKMQEAVAHMATMRDNPNFLHLQELTAASMDIVMFLMDYVEGIKV